MQDRPAWRELDAVRNRRFIVVSEAISHPSPRLVDAIEQLAAALYPSRFASQAAFAAHAQVRCPSRWSHHCPSQSWLSQPQAEPHEALTLRRVLWTCALLTAVLFAVVLLALRLARCRFRLPIWDRILWWLASGHPEKLSTDFRLIMVDIRLPRILLGIVVGAALSVAGASFQALLRNPLADPYVLGVSSGAALGAILALLVAAHACR